jgi:DNA-binding MarR family transcriptional regulator
LVRKKASTAAVRRRIRKPRSVAAARTAVRPIERTSAVEHRLVDAFSLVVRWGRRELHDKTVSETGIDIDRSAAAILGALYLHEPVRMSDLAEHLGLDRSTVSRQMAAVVAGGYVLRQGDATDARAAMLSLAPLGHAVRRRLALAFQRICVDLVADWKREDRLEFTRLLGKLADRLRKEGVC